MFIVVIHFSSIWPVSKHFVSMTAKDATRSYRPLSRTIIDMTTFGELFNGSARADKVAKLLQLKAKELCKRWNDHYSNPQVFFLDKKIKYFFVCFAAGVAAINNN